ncbi:MAG TPA: ferritin family protein [Clostridiaceae bacterium]
MDIIENKKFCVDLPYPKIAVNKKSREDARIISDDYASCISEFTAIAQFTIADIAIENEKIAGIFHGISIVEMNHFQKLGEVLIMLGGDPKLESGTNKIWRSNFVPYADSTKNRIKLAIKSEYDAIDQYQKHIRRIKNESVKRLLERIVIDENFHIGLFSELLKEFY